MTGIGIYNWTRVSRCNIISSVSTILLQENSFKARRKRAFFSPMSRPKIGCHEFALSKESEMAVEGKRTQRDYTL
ncbi:hypothetical protein, partial [Massilia horti]|uniref:hypothetical protein n=1 Tax=Massilia horti TaxID=2562153 RepID=UPI00197F2BFA